MPSVLHKLAAPILAPQRHHSIRFSLGAIFLLALAFRLLVLILFWDSWRWHEGRLHDSWDILTINLVESGTIGFEPGEPTLWRTPFFPAIASIPYLAFGRNYALWSLFFIVLDSATCIVIALSIRRIWNARVALLAALFYALHLPVVFYAAQIEQFIVTVPVVVIWTCSLTLWGKEPRPATATLAQAGVASGLLVLNKSVYMVFPVLGSAVVWMIRSRRRYDRSGRQAAGVLLVAATICAPWFARNHSVSGGRLLPVQLLGWWNFWADIYWDEYDHLTDEERAGRRLHNYVLQRHAEVFERMQGNAPQEGWSRAQIELFQEDYLSESGKEWIRDNPTGMLSRVIKNSWQFWIGAESTGKTLKFGILHSAFIGLGIWGLFQVYRAGKLLEVAIPALAIAMLWAQYSLVYAMGRFSLDMAPAMGLLFALGMDRRYAATDST